MKFIRRDFVLLGATAMIVMGVWMYLGLMYALGIGVGLFFGLKALAANRQAALNKKVGEGVCADCGGQIQGGVCPGCKGES